MAALRPLQPHSVAPGRVDVVADALSNVLVAIRLRDALNAVGLRPWVQLGGQRPQGTPGLVGVVAVTDTWCAPVRAFEWAWLGEHWVLVPDDLGACASDVLSMCLTACMDQPFVDLRSAMPTATEPGWLGLCVVRHWAGAAGLPVVEVPPPVRVLSESVVQPRHKGGECGPEAGIRRASLGVPGLDPPTVVLCESLAHLSAGARQVLQEAAAANRVWIVEGAPDEEVAHLSADDALMVALLGALGPDATVLALRRALPLRHDVERCLERVLEKRWALPVQDGVLRVRSEFVLRQAWQLAADPALNALQTWATQRGDRPGTLLAVSRARGDAPAVLSWLQHATRLGDWPGVLGMDRTALTGENAFAGASLVVGAAQAEADPSVLSWLRDRMLRSEERPRLALLGVGLAGHPEIGDASAQLELLKLAEGLPSEPGAAVQRMRWRAFGGEVHLPLDPDADLAVLVLVRISHGRFHGALTDLVEVPATRLDPLGLQHTVHLVLLLGLVGEYARARREVANLRRRSGRLLRGDGLRVAGVLARWIDAGVGEAHAGPLVEVPRGGGARVLSDVLSAETELAMGTTGAAVKLLQGVSYDGGSGLLGDVACGRGARLAATLATQGAMSPAEVEVWLARLRARSRCSVLAHLRLTLAEGILGADTGDARGAERLTGALESAVARGLHSDVRWLREALGRHQALSAADRAVYSAEATSTL